MGNGDLVLREEVSLFNINYRESYYDILNYLGEEKVVWILIVEKINVSKSILKKGYYDINRSYFYNFSVVIYNIIDIGGGRFLVNRFVLYVKIYFRIFECYLLNIRVYFSYRYNLKFFCFFMF